MQIPAPQDKLAEVDARLSRIEGIVEQLAERMASLEQGQREILSWIRGFVGLLVIVLIANVGTAISIIIALAKP